MIVGQLARYGCCGVLAALVHQLLFLLLMSGWVPGFEMAPVVSAAARANYFVVCNLAAFFGANLVSYVSNAYAVFEGGRRGRWAEFSWFTAINYATAAPGLLVAWWFAFLGHAILPVQVFFVVVSAIVNYMARKYWVFLM